MPRFASQNLANIDNNFSSADNKKRRYAFGKENDVTIVSGRKMLDAGFCLRLLPLYDETAKDSQGNRRFVPFRENGGFGDWLRVYNCAFWVGYPGVCFIVHSGDPDIPYRDNPLFVLHEAATKNLETPGVGKLFAELTSKQSVQNSHIGSLKRPEKISFISAGPVVIGDNGKPVIYNLEPRKENDRDYARIYGLKFSAAYSLNDALSVQDDEGNFIVGDDMLSFGPGKLISILPETFHSGDKNVIGIGSNGPAAVDPPRYARAPGKTYVVGRPRSKSDFTHFVLVHDTYNGAEISLEPYAETVVRDTKSFDEYLWMPTYEEQAEMLASAFPRAALDFAWRDYPEYMRTIPKGTTTSAPAQGSASTSFDPAPSAPAIAPPLTRAPQKAPEPPAADVMAAEIAPEDDISLGNWAKPAEAAPPAADQPSHADIIARARKHLANQ
jgi:hypothetical protein